MRKNCSQVVLENFFEPCMLLLLLEKDSYGYEIQKKLKDGCFCEVNIGNLYRTLARLQNQGHVKKKQTNSEIGPQRFNYTITSKGKKYLANWIESLKKQQQAINHLIISYQKAYETN